MNFAKTCVLTLLGLLAAPAAWGQDAPTTLIFGTYYRCAAGQEERADALFAEHMVPALKAEVAAGRIGAYGWGRHWLGGDWRRLYYISGTDLDKIIDARDAMVAKLRGDEASKKAVEEFNTICGSHDDYLWSTVASSQSATDVARVRSAVGMSTYYVCGNGESEADAIMKSAIAPILNRHVKEGKIASWSWLEHRMGGKYRRVLVTDSNDHKSAMKLWSTLVGAIRKEQPELFARFGEICDSHSDYIWDMTPAAK
jgi:hypothetical protein